MTEYYVDTIEQDNGDHEVHKLGCRFMPKVKHRFYLDDCTNSIDAVHAAKKIFTQSTGCVFCSSEYHAFVLDAYNYNEMRQRYGLILQGHGCPVGVLVYCVYGDEKTLIKTVIDTIEQLVGN